MDFKSKYQIYSKFKLSCDIPNYTVKNIMIGSGGSMNIIIRIELPGKKYLILKIMPQTLYYNVKKQPDFDKLEIKFYQFFTKKYLLTDRTPHIVGIYGTKQCSDIKKFIKKYLLNRACPTLTELLKGKSISESKEAICDILLRKEMKLLRDDFYLIALENCDGDLVRLLEKMISLSSKSKKFVHSLLAELERIFFQLIFTISIIKNDYPGYLHGDFFVRNVLYSIENEFKSSDIVAYHFKKIIFYLPANGIYAKINDFGMSIIVNEITPDVFDPHLDPRSIHNRNYNPFSKKTDLYNFLLDTYNYLDEFGLTFGLDANSVKSIEKFLSRFIDIKFLKKIRHQSILSDIWHIDGVKILTDTLLNPTDYLEQHHFDKFKTLKPGSHIIKNYNL